MTQARVTCPGCGEVRIDVLNVDLQVCSTDADRSFFSFACPGCMSDIRKHACPADVVALASAGVRHKVWRIPAEALEQHSGPPLTNDDLLDFVRELSSFVAPDPSAAASDAPSDSRGTTTSKGG